ncbi:MAG: tyrosine-type recombinase/integrase [Candidatus Paceibacterota bacterium]|jgi:integrase
MAVRKIKNSWWIDFWFNYVRYRKRSPENSRAAALAYEVVLRRKLAHGEDINAKPNESGQTFAQFAQRWFDEYVISNNKASECQTKRYILRSSLLPFFGKMPLGQITAHDVERYKAHALQKGAARKTVNNRLTVLNTCLTTAYEWLQLESTPPRIKRLVCPPPETNYLSEADAKLLLIGAKGMLNGVLYDLILTGLRTGMRLGELRGLQWTSIDWQNQNLVVRHSLVDRAKTLTSPKSNRERPIPLDVDVYDILLRRQRKSGFVFADERQHPFSACRLGAALTRACKKAGIRRITWHALRHTFASHLSMKGVPLNTIKELLGHTSIMTTMRYAHVAPSSYRAAIDLLNPRAALAADFGQPVVNRWLEIQRKQRGSMETAENILDLPHEIKG